MKATDAQAQLRYLEALLDDERVELAAGFISIQPPIDGELSRRKYRVVYTSWDGVRTRDLSNIERDDFLRFIGSEPGGLTSARTG